MARIAGRRTGLWVAGLLGLVILSPLAVIYPLGGAFALASAGGLAALLAVARARGLRLRCDKLSTEVDVLSQRLVRLEAVTRLIADQQMRIEQARAGQVDPVVAPGDPAAASAAVEEVTAEIGLLSGIVRELAAIVATQDGDIARLKAEPRPVPAPSPPPPSSQEVVVPPRRGEAAPVAPAPVQSAPASASAPWTPPPWPPATRDADPAPDLPRADRGREAALIAAFDGDGLEVHLQPVVSLPQRKVVSYEALARLRVEGEILDPDAFLPVLERHGRTTDLDRRMLQRVATIARHLTGRGSQAAVAYGLSPLSLFEPGFLRSLSRLVVGEPDLSGRLVIALPQSSWRSLDAEQASALADLRGRIGFALDRPIDLRLDPQALADRGVSQVKLPAELLLRPVSRQAMPDIALEDLVASLARAGIRLVADRVEREGDVPDLIDLDVPLAQGGVFAPARAVRAEVLGAAPIAPPVPAAPAQPASEEPEPPPQRRPFRDFLRRAG